MPKVTIILHSLHDAASRRYRCSASAPMICNLQQLDDPQPRFAAAWAVRLCICGAIDVCF